MPDETGTSGILARPLRADPGTGRRVTTTATTGTTLRGGTYVAKSWYLAAGFVAFYVLLDWASYVDPLPHTSITPWNPNTGAVMALLLARGIGWAPVAGFAIFIGELLTDAGPPPWPVLILTSTYLTGVYACAAWILGRSGFERPIITMRSAAWFAGVVAAATGIAASGYVAILVSTGVVAGDAMRLGVGRYWIGEFSGIIALTPVLLLEVQPDGLWQKICSHRAEFARQALGATLGAGLAFALAAARDVRLFYPLFAPVTWIALRHGVGGAMISVSIVQAGLVAALELTPGSIPLFNVQFPMLALGVTALFLGALAAERATAVRQMREQDAVLQRTLRFAVAGQLAAALTHELNQPMTALISYVRAAELMGSGGVAGDARLSDTLHKAGQEAQRAGEVLRRLRGFYRGAGARIEPTDVITVCTRVGEGLEDRMRRCNVEFKLRDCPLPKVMVDGTQLEIVLYNLVTNSLDAFDAVAVRRSLTGRIEITAETCGADVLISIDDSGPGIAAEISGRLFDPFVSSKAKGMGLGLSLSRTLLRHQDGDLWTEPSRLGGARFVVRLPTEPATQVSL
jgi:two-component system, LuxR family, sensor kinase FixL